MADGSPDGYRIRTADAPAERIAGTAGRPIVRHLSVTSAGTETYPGAHVAERARGAPFTIVCLCTAGAGWLRLDGVTHEAGADTVFVLPPGVPHVYGARTSPWSIWWVCVVGSEVADLVRAIGADRRTPVVRVRDTERIVAGIDDVIRSLEAPVSPAQELDAAGAAWRLLIALAVDRLRPGRGDPLERAMRLLAERPERELRVAELAAAVGVSPSRLHALFRAATGGGIVAYRTGLRMTTARRLLDTTTASVAQIARGLGYDDPYYFSRRFRRAHGMSPTEFRRRARP